MVGRSTKGTLHYHQGRILSRKLWITRNQARKKQPSRQAQESLAQQQKNELDSSSSINNYEDSSTMQKKSSFSSKEGLLDPKDKTRVSQGSEEMKELQDKGSWKTVEKKKKATIPISPRKMINQKIKN